MAVVAEADPHFATSGRQPRATDLIRLKLKLLKNGFRGEPWRVVAWVLGSIFGLLMAGLALLGLSATGVAEPAIGYLVAVFAGSAVVLAWAFVPLLFFGVDETLDPARFALLPVRRMTLARGMLGAAFVGVPAVVTLIGSAGLVIAAGIRFGWLSAVVATIGVILGLTVGVIASRALTSAFAALLRSRKVRDLAAVVIALVASSIGPVQLLVVTNAQSTTVDQAVGVARVLAWTPLAAPYVLPFDVAAGDWLAASLRLALTLVTIALLLWWWSFTIESAMVGVTSGGAGGRARGGASAVGALITPMLRGVARPSVFGAVLACEWRLWWRDPRRRASLVSILMASAVLPIALNIASSENPAPTGLGTLPFSFAVTMAGTMGGMLLANQFAFDGSAYAAHLMAQVPGRVELRARALAIGLVAIPVQLAVVVAVSVFTGKLAQLPAGIGMLAASFGAAVAAAGVLSVLAPYPLPENSNPFALNQGGGSAKGLLAVLAMVGTLVLCAPVIIAAYWLIGSVTGVWVVATVGLAYGLGLAALGTYIAGDVLQRRGPEVLIAVTPRR